MCWLAAESACFVLFLLSSVSKSPGPLLTSPPQSKFSLLAPVPLYVVLSCSCPVRPGLFPFPFVFQLTFRSWPSSPVRPPSSQTSPDQPKPFQASASQSKPAQTLRNHLKPNKTNKKTEPGPPRLPTRVFLRAFLRAFLSQYSVGVPKIRGPGARAESSEADLRKNIRCGA